MPLTIGVLALQGQISSHFAAFRQLGVTARPVRVPDELAGVDALVIPGGESTTMWMLAESSGCFDAIKGRLAEGMAAFGTCAGMIMLASEVMDGRQDQRTFSAIDIAVRRNAFGRQVASFESDLQLDAVPGAGEPGTAEPFRAVFIRAPWVEKVGANVEVLATVPAPAQPHQSAEPHQSTEVAVLCREGNVLVSSFHPELTNDLRIHQMFLELVLQR